MCTCITCSCQVMHVNTQKWLIGKNCDECLEPTLTNRIDNFDSRAVILYVQWNLDYPDPFVHGEFSQNWIAEMFQLSEVPYKVPLVGVEIAHMSSNDVTAVVQLAIAPYSCDHQAAQNTGRHLNCATILDT